MGRVGSHNSSKSVRYYNGMCAMIQRQLAGYDPETLAMWYVILSHWEWPTECPIAIPQGWDEWGLGVDTKWILGAPLWEVLDSLTTPEQRSWASWQLRGETHDDWQDWWDAVGQHGPKELD